ncbi:MAG TPA: TIGR03936 family radical SAM-associated protein [Syntrophomonas sp.]|mgnify:CR=1 FL=1|nr:TIGR03936 family radical SAM-associated protein [Syntrophomonas sp.]
MRLRVEYSAGPELKFLANLDMMHLMERALRRAGIPYHLSEGFNPHIRLSMGTILPVGVWGKHEYFDLDLEEMDQQDFISGMNEVLPAALTITDCQQIEDNAPSLMKIINAAEYTFVISAGNDLQALINGILNQDSLLVQSRGKNKNVQKDLRPGLYQMNITTAEEYDMLSVMVSINEPLNIRYDELQALFIEHGINAKDIADIFRQGNYIKEGQQFYSPIKRV